MDKVYQPGAVEGRWYQYWEEQQYFAPSGHGAPYCIMLPPPNITGSLHMGHAFQQTLMDILIRCQRMRGHDTLWQGGTDHAGIATQMVVERQLEADGRSRSELGREAFVQAIWDWKKQSGGTISQQSRRMGASLDWSRECFTLDPGLSAAVRRVFVQLHEEGLIYRGTRLVNWDPCLHTALSDLEVSAVEEDGSLWRLRYPLVAGDSHVVVATTRPETLLGDAAVAVHPEDERYQGLIGKSLQLPLCDRQIPIIADPGVDPQFGTGCVKITPGHDFNDYRMGQTHGLPLYNILTADARISEDAPAAWRGLDRYEARRRIVATLRDQGLLEGEDPHRHVVPRGDRSGCVLEPWLTEQWYVRTAALAAEAVRAVEQGEVRFVPDSWARTYYEWMRNIEDWCISRQLWWGHRIPAWYDDAGNCYIAENEDAVRRKYQLDAGLALKQDEDVLDTWFSSALWPFSTLGWPEQSPGLDRYYPGAVLVTGFDIIFFWVARMIMMGLKFMGRVPFREVYIHGLVRDARGQKMSKSRGNVLDPIDLVDGIDLEALVAKRTSGLMQPQHAPAIARETRRQFPHGISAHGADSLRLTFASLAGHGRDVRFDVGRIQGQRNFCNKLWNAARYVLMNQAEDEAEQQGSARRDGAAVKEGEAALLHPADRWIESRLAALIDECDTQLDRYRFDLASQALYEFTWNEYCDWHLELCKVSLSDPARPAGARAATRRNLLVVLERLLRLLHPFAPFISEELWQHTAPRLGIAGDSIMRQPWPQSEELSRDEAACREIGWLQQFVSGVRQIRSSRNISPGRTLAVQVRGGSREERSWLADHSPAIQRLARVGDIGEAQSTDNAAVGWAGDMLLAVPLADLIDRKAELARLNQALQKLQKEQEQVERKLENQEFVQRAPQAVVDRAQQRLQEIVRAREKFSAQYQQIESL